MGEKWGHSDFGSFDIQIMVKSNAIIIFSNFLGRLRFTS